MNKTPNLFSTRMLSFFLICAFILAACGAPTSPVPTSASNQTAGSAIPAQQSLGDCIDAREPTPDPNEVSLFPAVTEKDHILGDKNAYVTILLYSDFQCAACGKLALLLEALLEKYPRDIRVVFRQFPLESIHDKAALAAQAAEAAALQNKFWEMHDFLFAKQSEWQNQNPLEFQQWIISQSSQLGLNKAKFETDLTSPVVTTIVQNAWEGGLKIKLPGAPVILVNGEIMKWQTNLLDQLEGFVLLTLLQSKQFSSCPPIVIDPTKQYIARLKTSRGDVVLKLFADKAPNTVNNFIFLTQKGWYNNIPFHLVIPASLAQTGDPTGTGLGSPGYFIPSEKNTALMYDRAGMVGMANAGPDSNGSQFFITLAPATQLNRDHPIFGEVTSGLEVLAKLTPHDPSDTSNNSKPDMLISVTIETR